MSQENEFGDIARGFSLAIGLNILAAIFFLVMATLFSNLQLPFSFLFIYLFYGIGLSQLVYIIPIAIRFYRRRQWGRMKGVIIGAVITALLNGGCFLAIQGMQI